MWIQKAASLNKNNKIGAGGGRRKKETIAWPPASEPLCSQPLPTGNRLQIMQTEILAYCQVTVLSFSWSPGDPPLPLSIQPGLPPRLPYSSLPSVSLLPTSQTPRLATANNSVITDFFPPTAGDSANLLIKDPITIGSVWTDYNRSRNTAVLILEDSCLGASDCAVVLALKMGKNHNATPSTHSQNHSQPDW